MITAHLEPLLILILRSACSSEETKAQQEVDDLGLELSSAFLVLVPSASLCRGCHTVLGLLGLTPHQTVASFGAGIFSGTEVMG